MSGSETYGVWEQSTGVLWSVDPDTAENAVREAELSGPGHEAVSTEMGNRLRRAWSAGHFASVLRDRESRNGATARRKWDHCANGVYLVLDGDNYPVVVMPDYDNGDMLDAEGNTFPLQPYHRVMYLSNADMLEPIKEKEHG